MQFHKLAFVGAGSIAEAVIAGLIETNFVTGTQITVSNRSSQERLAYLHNTYGVIGTHNKKELIEGADIIFFAMKPKDVVEAVASVKEYIHEEQLIISLMAGVSSASLMNLLEQNNPIIRAMPNTSATILQSATAIAPSAYATEAHVAFAESLFQNIGVVSVVEEEQMHAVTALSGSGPAYIYYVVEAMEKAALNIGLTEDISKPLILQTIIGAAEMLKSTRKLPSVLRQEITSPGGTTQAGIGVLANYDCQEAFIQCITEATKRSHELGEVLENALKK